jgi:hypothetical protein
VDHRFLGNEKATPVHDEPGEVRKQNLFQGLRKVAIRIAVLVRGVAAFDVEGLQPDVHLAARAMKIVGGFIRRVRVEEPSVRKAGVAEGEDQLGPTAAERKR